MDTIDELDPICAPIYRSEEYKSLFLNSDDATSIPEIEKGILSIFSKFVPTIGWRNVAKAVAPLEAYLKRNAMKSEIESRAYMHEQELGARESHRSLNRTDNFAKCIDNFFENKNYNAKGETIN